MQLIFLTIIAIIFRVWLSSFPSFQVDESAFRFWSLKLAQLGPVNFYFNSFFTSNPIGFFYPLWFNGLLIKNFAPWILGNITVFDMVLKFPANIADILSGIIIYSLVGKKLGKTWGYLGFLFYVFNPAIFFNSSIWGQYDGIPALFLLLSLYLITIKKNPEVSYVSFAIALTLKPQTIMFAPILIILTFLKTKPLIWLLSFVTFFSTLMLIYLPFFPTNPIYGLIFVNQGSAKLYSCTTCFALNFWGVFGNWKNDLSLFLGIPLLVWGIFLVSFIMAFVLFVKKVRLKFTVPNIYLTTAVSFLVFFTFLTRMHERYLFPFFVFFLLAALLLKSRVLLSLYLVMSLMYVINLYIPYEYYNQSLQKNSQLLSVLLNSFNFLSGILLCLTVIILILFFRIISKNEDN